MKANGFRICFTPLAGVLFTVPSRYCALSVTSCMAPWAVGGPASHPVARVGCYSSSRTRGGGRWLLRDSHPLWCDVPIRFGPRPAAHGPGMQPGQVRTSNPSAATPARLARHWFRQAPGSLATTTGVILVPPGTEMFQFPRCPPSRRTVLVVRPAGCPIRRWWDHQLRALPPPLSQRCHVLHRHDAPRHPPLAQSVFPAPTAPRGGAGQVFYCVTNLHLERYMRWPRGHPRSLHP
jgi:hypothetical protein